MGKGQNARIKRDNFNKRKNNSIKRGSTSSYTSLTLSKILSPLTTSKKELSKHKIKQSARRLKEELDNTNIEEIQDLIQPKATKKNAAAQLEKMEQYRRLQQEKQLQKEQLNNDFELALEKLGAI
ncbi:hypothetical protein PIROE2DRAFT_8494 [Piromyces sp. E2]|nr:hypothetical protein PIROE2DRAFT_8494 [Piromyces sp. E2]|eukprot:OUM64656.1 hypothetical protein PIROE2DRAFT_8494 [Piromyces sp. E2]